MDKISDINYEILNYDSTYGNTRLELKISGECIDYIIINTLRRTILWDIPIYAFTEFNFKTNTTIFNNNYIKLRIKNIPVLGIENKNDTYFNDKKKSLDTIDDNEEFVDDNIDLDNNNKINSSTLKQITMFVDYTSKSKDIITVTTDDAKFYYNEKRIESPYKIPIPLIKLQPDQTITFSVISSIGCERDNTIYSPTSICCYEYDPEKPNDYIFYLESKGQINEKRIIEVAIINIFEKFKKLNNLMMQYENNEENIKEKGEIIIMDEDNTIGNLITTGLQKHKNIVFAGYNIPHLLERKVIIHYQTDNKKTIKHIFNDVIKYYNTIFELIMEKNKKIKLN